MRSLVVALASGLVFQTMASPIFHSVISKREIPATHSLHERHLPHWGQQWMKKSKVPSSQILPMRIGLKQHNLQVGHDKLMEM